MPTSAIFPFGTGSTIYYPGYSVTTSGAVGDGVTDNSAVVIAAQTIAAAAGQALFFPAGSYVFKSSVAFTVPVVFADGAELLPQTGAVLSFAAPIDAQPTQIFSTTSGGTVTITGATPFIYPQWWGASGNGSTDNTAALTAASAALATNVGLYFPPGTYYFASSYTTTVPFTLAPGAVIQIASTKTFAFTAPLIAGPEYCLSLATGTFTIDGHTPVIYAEWFGAKGDGVTDDSAAINAAIAAGASIGSPCVQFLAKTYYHLTTITITRSNIVLQGAGMGVTYLNTATNAVDNIQVTGTSGTPLTYVTIRDLSLSTNAATAVSANGISVLYANLCSVRNIRVSYHAITIRISGTNGFEAHSIFSSPIAGSPSAMFGAYIDGTYYNNSVNFTECNFNAQGPTPTSSYGYFASGAHINDLFFNDCEASGGWQYGFALNGASCVAYGNVDIHLTRCISDFCTIYGFYILNFGAGSIVEVNGGWACADGASGTTAVYVVGSYGVNIRDLQVLQLTTATGTNIGIELNNCYSCSVQRNSIRNFQYGILLNGDGVHLVQGNDIFNQTSVSGVNGIVIQGSCTRCDVSHNSVNAGANLWTVGILAASGSDYCNIIGNIVPPTGSTTTISNNAANTHSVVLGVQV